MRFYRVFTTNVHSRYIMCEVPGGPITSWADPIDYATMVANWDDRRDLYTEAELILESWGPAVLAAWKAQDDTAHDADQDRIIGARVDEELAGAGTPEALAVLRSDATIRERMRFLEQLGPEETDT